jgi:hypothetical protein
MSFLEGAEQRVVYHNTGICGIPDSQPILSPVGALGCESLEFAFISRLQEMLLSPIGERLLHYK